MRFKTIITALAAAPLLTGCLVTAGDLRELNDEFQYQVGTLTSTINEGLAEQGEAIEEVFDKQDELAEALEQGASDDELFDLQAELNELRDDYVDSVSSFETTAKQAASTAIEGFGATVNNKIEEVAKRATDLQADVAWASQKAAQGPSGWMEILGAVGASTIAGGLGLNTLRNRSRRRDLGDVEGRAIQSAQGVAEGTIRGVFTQPQGVYQQPPPPYQPATGTATPYRSTLDPGAQA